SPTQRMRSVARSMRACWAGVTVVGADASSAVLWMAVGGAVAWSLQATVPRATIRTAALPSAIAFVVEERTLAVRMMASSVVSGMCGAAGRRRDGKAHGR